MRDCTRSGDGLRREKREKLPVAPWEDATGSKRFESRSKRVRSADGHASGIVVRVVVIVVVRMPVLALGSGMLALLGGRSMEPRRVRLPMHFAQFENRYVV